MLKYKRVSITWADHYYDEEPVTLEEVQKNLKAMTRITSGFLIAENKRVIAIASTIDEDGTFSEVNYLMKRAILSREY